MEHRQGRAKEYSTGKESTTKDEAAEQWKSTFRQNTTALLLSRLHWGRLNLWTSYEEFQAIFTE
ncbi:hypothetical protein D5R40_33925 [Okeania hirsuta]|uniref:Uncharacterized protein n=1 Tax=Okeania hirsuta TaxID=1458930 RepID=A0A3N6P2T8_9CYAN|nr:hypothetical protein D5R40_33925 [Okeania hirsuta]